MKDYLKLRSNIQYLFFSTIQLISLITLIIFSYIVFTSPSLSEPLSKYLPIKIQEKRAFFLISVSVFSIITIFTIYLYLSKKCFLNKIFNILIPFISFLFIPLFLKKIIKQKELKEYIKAEYSTKSNFQIFWFNKDKNNTNNKAIIWNSIFTIFAFIVAFISFVFMITSNETDKNNPTGSLMIGIYSYFTEWTNFGTFIFMLILIITGHRFFFQNNSFTLAMSSYIGIVGGCFTLALIPMSTLYHIPFSNPLTTTKTVWFHMVNPIIFCLFCGYLLWKVKQPLPKYGSFMVYSSIFPSIYGVYVYSLPWFTNVSIYGFVTNLNDNIVPYFGSDNPSFYNGGWESSFFLLGIILLFFIVLSLSRFLLKKNLKKWSLQDFKIIDKI